MKKYIIADIHGCHRALIQCLKRSKFNYDKDELIVLGDVVDGYPETKQCIDELLKIKNLIYVLGNHDLWCLTWMGDPFASQPEIWLSQGGRATQKSYQTKFISTEGEIEYTIPKEHSQFLRNGNFLYTDEKNNLFVHGGINPNQQNIEKQNIDVVTWDRDLFYSAHDKHYHGRKSLKFGGFNNIFIGHTTTQTFKSLKPLHYCNVWNLDTGGGWSGKLTIMNIDTKEYWQSDLTPTLYPECKGRN